MSQNPYQTSSTQTSSPDGYRYKPLRVLALLVSLAVGVTCLIQLMLVLMQTYGLMTYENFSDPTVFPGSPAESNLVDGVLMLAIISIPPYLLGAIFVCMYLYRANANLHARNEMGLDFTPGWCAGWWFVPIMHLFKPYQVVSEVYERSISSKFNASTTIVGVWWACWIIAQVSNRIESRLALTGVDPGIGGSMAMTWVGGLTMIIAGVLLIMMVRSISQAQDAR